jgi:hypothetical protein
VVKQTSTTIRNIRFAGKGVGLQESYKLAKTHKIS